MTKEELLKKGLGKLKIIGFTAYGSIDIRLKFDLRRKDFIELCLYNINNRGGQPKWQGVFVILNDDDADDGMYITPFKYLYASEEDVIKLIDRFKYDISDDKLDELKYIIERRGYESTHHYITDREWSDYCERKYKETKKEIWNEKAKEYYKYYLGR